MIEEHHPQKHINSFRYALNGLSHAFLTQRNFRLQTALGITTIIAAFCFSFDRLEWIVLLLTIGMVLIAELANTTLETLVDLASPDIHPKAKVAKDLSAAAVMLVALFSAVIGLLLFVPHLQALFNY